MTGNSFANAMSNYNQQLSTEKPEDSDGPLKIASMMGKSGATETLDGINYSYPGNGDDEEEEEEENEMIPGPSGRKVILPFTDINEEGDGIASSPNDKGQNEAKLGKRRLAKVSSEKPQNKKTKLVYEHGIAEKERKVNEIPAMQPMEGDEVSDQELDANLATKNEIKAFAKALKDMPRTIYGKVQILSSKQLHQTFPTEVDERGRLYKTSRFRRASNADLNLTNDEYTKLMQTVSKYPERHLNDPLFWSADGKPNRKPAPKIQGQPMTIDGKFGNHKTSRTKDKSIAIIQPPWNQTTILEHMYMLASKPISASTLRQERLGKVVVNRVNEYRRHLRQIVKERRIMERYRSDIFEKLPRLKENNDFLKTTCEDLVNEINDVKDRLNAALTHCPEDIQTRLKVPGTPNRTDEETVASIIQDGYSKVPELPQADPHYDEAGSPDSLGGFDEVYADPLLEPAEEDLEGLIVHKED
jgi:hypothetical protein